MSQRIYMNYLGVLSLLGRISQNADLSATDKEAVHCAMGDANAILNARKSEVIFARAGSRNGWALFERSQVKKDATK